LGFVAISRCSGFGSHAGPMVPILPSAIPDH
jgi:hypothetical protein